MFYIWVCLTQQQRTSWKKIQFKQHLATTFRCLTKKVMVLVYRNTFFTYLTVLAPMDPFGVHSNRAIWHAIKLPSRINGLFYHANYLGSEQDHNHFLNLFVHSFEEQATRVTKCLEYLLTVALDQQINVGNVSWTSVKMSMNWWDLNGIAHIYIYISVSVVVLK